MLTLSDINSVTKSKDGDSYSDLHKDVFGFRPRNAQFVSVEAFDDDYKSLVKQLSEQLDEDMIRQAANIEKFADRVRETMQLCNCDQKRAVEIIADAEGEADGYKWYGPSCLEFHFDLRYGSIKQAIFGEFE